MATIDMACVVPSQRTLALLLYFANAFDLEFGFVCIAAIPQSDFQQIAQPEHTHEHITSLQ